MVKYEELLVHIGQFGRWQKLCVCLLWLPPMFAGIHNLLFVFTGLNRIQEYGKVTVSNGWGGEDIGVLKEFISNLKASDSI